MDALNNSIFARIEKVASQGWQARNSGGKVSAEGVSPSIVELA
jgi:hypothetical protein